MEDEEREHYTKLLIFTCGISLDVFHLYFDIKILDKEELFLFLDRCKHVLFHALHPAVYCCECRNVSIPFSQKPPRLCSKQFNLLFDIENSTLQSHHYQTIQHCLCKYSASRSVEVDSLDISLVCAIVNICCPSIHGNPQWIKDIKDTRNFLAHKANCRITKEEYDSWLAFVENATLDLANVVSLKYGKITQKQISDFKKDKLSSNTVKDILASSNDDVCKRLESLMRNILNQDSKSMEKVLIEYMRKCKDEVLIEIRELGSPFKTHTGEQLPSKNITEKSTETGCATSTLQTPQPQRTQSQNEESTQTGCATSTLQTAQPQSPQSKNEDQRLIYERECPEEGATGDVSRLSGLLTEETGVSEEYHNEQTDRYVTLLKGIWDNITEHELHDIKQYLLMKAYPKFGRAGLQKGTTCMILLRLLHDRNLLGINNLSFIKKILEHMNRHDLLMKVSNYENQSVKVVDAKPSRQKSDLTYASSDSRCESRHIQQSIDKKKLEIQQQILDQSNLSTKLEKLTEDMEKQTDIIADIEMELTRLELEKKQKRENERKCRDEREKRETKIQQLPKESSEQLDLERSLRDDIDRMSQTERDVQYLISQSKYKKNEIAEQYKNESGKERECSQIINSLQLELHKLELQINRRSENLQYEPRQMPNSNENGKY